MNRYEIFAKNMALLILSRAIGAVHCILHRGVRLPERAPAPTYLSAVRLLIDGLKQIEAEALAHETHAPSESHPDNSNSDLGLEQSIENFLHFIEGSGVLGTVWRLGKGELVELMFSRKNRALANAFWLLMGF